MRTIAGCVLTATISALLLAGCGGGENPDPRAKTPSPGTSPDTQPVQPDASPTPPPAQPASPKPQRTSPHALPKGKMPEKPEGVKLVPLQFELNDIDLVIDAPEGTTVEDSYSKKFAAGPHFGMSVNVAPIANKTLDEVRAEALDADPAYLIDTDNAILVEVTEFGDRTLAFAMTKTVGYVDYGFSPVTFRDGEGLVYSPDDCKLMLYCASTLRRKNPVSDDPKVLLKELMMLADYEHGLEVREGENTTDSTLALLPQVPPFATLSLDSHITDRGMGPVGTLDKLRELYLRDTRITDAGLQHLTGTTGLEILCLKCREGGPKVTLEGLAHVRGLNALHSLEIEGADLSSGDLSFLAQMKQLKELVLEDCAVTDAALAGLADAGHLEKLVLKGNPISDGGFANLKGLTNLTTLDLSGTKVTGAGLTPLHAVTGIQMLGLNGVALKSEDLSFVSNMTRLSELRLDDCQLTDASLSVFLPLTNLTTLSLDGNAITDDGLLTLTGLTKLKSLGARRTKVTKGGVEEFQKALERCGVSFE